MYQVFHYKLHLYGKIPLWYLQNFLVYIQENFEDANGVIRSCTSKEDRKYNGKKKKDKMTNNG